MVPLARPNSLVSARAEGMRSPGFNNPLAMALAKPIVDLAIKRFGRRWIQRRDLAGLCDGHGLANSQMDEKSLCHNGADRRRATNTTLQRSGSARPATSWTSRNFHSWTLDLGHEVRK